jgi:hypothetical protein
MTHLLPKAHLRLLTQLTAAFAVLGLFGAAGAAAASYETVGTFAGTPTPPAEGGEWPQQVQLGGVGGLAINRTGAGGVAKGTIYASVPENFAGNDSSRPELPPAVARYAPDGTFEETFSDPAFTTPSPVRCGPLVSAAPVCGSRPFSGRARTDVDIDQSTGNVYFMNGEKVSGTMITVFNPDSEVIARFGVTDSGETASESPDKIHGAADGGIAVNDDGEVYVFDEDRGTDFYRRVMVFKPETPGDYEHYVYAGATSDIGGIFGGDKPGPGPLMLDDAGDIYASGDSYIVKYDLSVSRANPVCTFKIATGIRSFAVDPTTGEVFYYSSANRKVHQLNACNAEGKFVETQPAFKAVPERDSLSALAFNSERSIGELNPPGVLYGAAPNGSNIGGIGGDDSQSSLGYIFSRPPSLTPVVESESVADVRTTSATLRASINPKGSLTSYAFQYISLADWEANDPSERFAGATEVPIGGAELGSGLKPLLASTAVSGLAPAGTYHYRAVASNESGLDVGDDQIFRTFALEPPGLPDGRVYEQVSPVEKKGGEVVTTEPSRATCGAECKPGLVGERFPVVASPDGDSIAYVSQPFRLNTGPIELDQNIARRSAGGWVSTGIGVPNSSAGAPYVSYALDPGFSKAIVFLNNPSLTPEAPLGYQNLMTQRTDDPSDLESVLKAAPPNRTSEGPNGFVLKYAGASSDLSRVFFAANDALTGATGVAPAAQDGGVNQDNLYEWSQGEFHLVNVAPGNASTAPGAGFGAKGTLEQHDAAVLAHAISSDGSRVFWHDAGGQVYVRENAEATREIPDPGQFLSASADGSKVLLSSGNIYDLDTETTTDLTEGESGFLGLVGQTDDLSRLYFVSTSVLDDVANAQGDAAEKGKANLYAWKEGSSRYVATLLPSDNSTNGGSAGDWSASPIQRTAQASSDGNVVAFLSSSRLTDTDNTGVCSNGLNPDKLAACFEVYVYDADSESLNCASCNPVGALALGRSFLPTRPDFKTGYLPQTRFVTNSGRVYFDSRDSLSPQDTNGEIEDVYQYEPEGVGSCGRVGGCISLISAGREKYDSNLVTIDATGKNVFFVTRDQLVLNDKDDLIDLYVAREGGGFGAETEIGRGECQGEACQPPYSPPNDPTPASLNYDGAGNVVEKPPARKHKKHHKKKHKKKKHASKHKNGKHNRGGAK